MCWQWLNSLKRNVELPCCSITIGRGGDRWVPMSSFTCEDFSTLTKVTCLFCILLYDYIPHSHSDHLHMTVSAFREEKEEQLSEKQIPSNGKQIHQIICRCKTWICSRSLSILLSRLHSGFSETHEREVTFYTQHTASQC